jgi:hypothetical protein
MIDNGEHSFCCVSVHGFFEHYFQIDYIIFDKKQTKVIIDNERFTARFEIEQLLSIVYVRQNELGNVIAFVYQRNQ